MEIRTNFCFRSNLTFSVFESGRSASDVMVVVVGLRSKVLNFEKTHSLPWIEFLSRHHFQSKNYFPRFNFRVSILNRNFRLRESPIRVLTETADFFDLNAFKSPPSVEPRIFLIVLMKTRMHLFINSYRFTSCRF